MLRREYVLGGQRQMVQRAGERMRSFVPCFFRGEAALVLLCSPSNVLPNEEADAAPDQGRSCSVTSTVYQIVSPFLLGIEYVGRDMFHNAPNGDAIMIKVESGYLSKVDNKEEVKLLVKFSIYIIDVSALYL
ncbi:hypothetical protein CFP56_034234 [Quercus suber]|uniref:Uncharacterized protein n=1 Tax=Quercus suber TaxID=58331 RepID=A0AAW0JD18_QUESU